VGWLIVRVRAVSRSVLRLNLFLWSVSVSSIVSLIHALYLFFVQWLVVKFWLGHGERPGRVLLVALVIIVGTTVAYWLAGTFVVDAATSPSATGHPEFSDAIYYSLVSFVALGYGSWALQPLGWAQWAGAAESVLGIFSVVFFSITFAQRITR